MKKQSTFQNFHQGLKFWLWIGLLSLSNSLAAQCPTSNMVFVDTDATGTNDGTSWANAFPNLQDALALVRGGTCTSPALTEIWVAAGTYYPDEGVGKTDNDRGAFFEMIEAVGIYGGFAGSESNRSERNWGTNVTILSGDIDQNDGTDANEGITNNENNSKRIIQNSANNLTNAAVLDGFTLTANYLGIVDDVTIGGAIYNFNSSPIIANCRILGNFHNHSANNSSGGGGGIYNRNASPIIYNCEFKGNIGEYGGGAFNRGGAPQFINCTFSGNKAFEAGSAIRNVSGSTPILKNCIFWNNAALNGNPEGGINNNGGTATVENSIVQGGYAGGTNILDVDPLFTTAVDLTAVVNFTSSANGDLSLQECSPAIDMGSIAIIVPPRMFWAILGSLMPLIPARLPST